MTSSSLRRVPNIFVIVIIFLYVCICFAHYFSARALWLDERFVFDNMMDKSAAQLFGPLDQSQAFPRVHLVLIKIFSAPFDYHVLALRFVSLVCMLSAFFIWVYFYRREFSDDWLFLLSVLAFAGSYRLAYFSAEFKPYAADVLVVSLYALFAQYQKQAANRNTGAIDARLWAGSMILPFLLLFSYAGLFVVWIIGYNFFILARKNKSYWTLFVMNSFLSTICFVLFYFLDLRHSLDAGSLRNYWESYFICTDSARCFFDTFGDGLKKIVTYWSGTTKYHIRAAVPFVPFCLGGLFYFGARSIKEDEAGVFRLSGFMLILLVELFVLGILKQYPFTGVRVTLFLAPFVFLLTIKALASITKTRKFKALGTVLLLYFAGYHLVCFVQTFLKLI